MYTSKRKSYYLKRYYDRRAKALAYMGGECVACGTTDGLEFDHINPSEKMFDIASLITASWSRLEAELLKCQLLCKKCHKEKSDKESTTRTHGTPTMYRRGKCRCEGCVKANSEYIVSFRKRRTRLVVG